MKITNYNTIANVSKYILYKHCAEYIVLYIRGLQSLDAAGLYEHIIMDNFVILWRMKTFLKY